MSLLRIAFVTALLSALAHTQPPRNRATLTRTG